jgi:redox-sensitive bicupin YhaK (pirin superfamily)
VVLASGFADETDALPIRADARVLGAMLTVGQRLACALAPGRKAYLVPTQGGIMLNDRLIEARDGAAVQNEPAIQIEAVVDTELVLVDDDLPPSVSEGSGVS